MPACPATPLIVPPAIPRGQAGASSFRQQRQQPHREQIAEQGGARRLVLSVRGHGSFFATTSPSKTIQTPRGNLG